MLPFRVIQAEKSHFRAALGSPTRQHSRGMPAGKPHSPRGKQIRKKSDNHRTFRATFSHAGL